MQKILANVHSAQYFIHARLSNNSSRASRDNTTFRVSSLRVPPASMLYCYDKEWINIPVHVRGFYALIPAHIYANRVGFVSSDVTRWYIK